MTKYKFDRIDLIIKLNNLIVSGGPSKIKFTQNEILFLKKSVKVPIKLYRGISFIRSRVNKSLWKQVDGLKIGDNLPRYLQKSHVYDRYASYSTKKVVATHYARGGNVSIVVEKIFTDKSQILVNFFNLAKIMPDSTFIKDHLDYFREEKEVIVLEPINGLKIIKKRGWFIRY